MTKLVPLIFLVVFFLMYLYIYHRLVKKIDFGTRTKQGLIIVLISTYIGVVFYALSRYYIDVVLSVYYFLSLSIGIGFILFVMTVMYEFLSLVSKVIQDDKRRAFFKKSIDYLVLVGGISYASASSIDAKEIVIEEVDIKIKNLQKEYSIVQISDVHIGGLIDKKFVIDLVNKINNLQADVVVITGDLIDTKVENITDVLDELKYIKSKFGTYFILGNHEYFHNPIKVIEYVEALGIKVLKNSSVVIDDGFNLLGIYDRFGQKIDFLPPSLTDAKKDIKENLPNILLCHQPKYIRENVIENIDLVLCGHTHGGQLFPFALLVKLDQLYLSGLYKQDDMQIYINRGTGFWGPPMRLLSKAEITHLKLKQGTN